MPPGRLCIPYLFLLVIEPLLCKLRQLLPPIRTSKGNCSTVFAYADDCNCIILGQRQIRRCLDALHTYASFSGLEINREKSEILPLPDWRVEQNSLMGIRITNHITITGTRISADFEEDCRLNFEATIDRVEEILEGLSSRSLSLGGKSLIINSKIYGTLLHHFRHGKMSTSAAKRLNRAIYRFLWNGPDRVKHVRRNPRENQKRGPQHLRRT